ncbi:BQ00720 family protein [Mesorhizobium xinjiangense]|uniref:BQ00720 family protein n=1 Tax=Mesorhizobium xinjiangense TaxID=2678685 RepID=UPI0018DC8D67|nr:DUF1150 family protein [Mesorhizobium xinjiangense]
MTENEAKNIMTEAQFAHLGEGAVAYLKKVSSDDLRGRYPNLPEMAPGLELWAVFGANGQPILLTDAHDSALAGAMQNDLTPVSIH